MNYNHIKVSLGGRGVTSKFSFLCIIIAIYIMYGTNDTSAEVRRAKNVCHLVGVNISQHTQMHKCVLTAFGIADHFSCIKCYISLTVSAVSNPRETFM